MKFFMKGIKPLIGPIEKGFSKNKVIEPKDEGEQIDLKALPKFIAYKAALMREKLSMQYFLLIAIALFCIHFVATRIEITALHKQLREKEYILAPGVMDFTKASPHVLPNSYVYDASIDFLSSLGNISSDNIDEQYTSLKRFMSNELKIQFEIDSADWVNQVKSENISQISKLSNVTIVSNEVGDYKVNATGKVDLYADKNYLGYEEQVVEMILRLVPPESGKRWYLQIISLSIEKAETFDKKSEFSNKP